MKTIFRLITFITLLILPLYEAYSRTTYEQVLSNNSNISKSRASHIAFVIDALADKYRVPANVIAAIAMVESSYRLNAINKKSSDYGIMQVNQYNIKAYNFNRQLLLTDLAYSIEAGVIVFKWFYKTYHTLEEAVKRYNCGVRASCVHWRGPKKYWKKVTTYM